MHDAAGVFPAVRVADRGEQARGLTVADAALRPDPRAERVPAHDAFQVEAGLVLGALKHCGEFGEPGDVGVGGVEAESAFTAVFVCPGAGELAEPVLGGEHRPLDVIERCGGDLENGVSQHEDPLGFAARLVLADRLSLSDEEALGFVGQVVAEGVVPGQRMHNGCRRMPGRPGD